MNLREIVRDVLQTALRLFPWPTEPGLRLVGNPDSESPVLVTGNYDLTVRRLIAALKGLDAWLVVAPSRGINVWCAAAGGLLTTSQVVTALKTSGIEGRVHHRRAILPQLAATGIAGREVARRCGWKVRFGPVHARDIPRYLAGGGHKDESMRRVRFGNRERLEMAVAWAMPISAVFAVVLAFVHRQWAGFVVVQVWAMSAACFFVYDRLGRARWVIMWGASVAAAWVGAAALGATAGTLAASAGSATLILALLTFDYAGSTPTEGGSHFDARRWHITLDLDRCAGVFSCWEVCPEACFEKREDVRKVALAHDDRCVKCGACVVQCPQDALYFTDDTGRAIPPDVIRRYKLNMLGTRGVDSGD
jgi:NAD-dependent dihydropyrimidine dehydrogenase PreA subunit